MSHKHHHKEPQKPADAPELKETPTVSIPLDDATEKLRAELEQAKDRALRLQAELENYRKRASRELEDRLRYANIGMLRDLLPVLDNIQRAVESAEKSPDPAGLLEGFKIVGSQLAGVLECHQCKKIEALYAPFDPNLHHAISQMPAAEFPPNTVVLVSQEGYQLHDRVVRPSQVIVSTAVPQAAENENEQRE
ncbi:MAG: nucleotide exchange factor GrpE [Pirellulales bacterium]|nr:nucleotide exchange factor GrpE [Pirellulales bacterium]